jgi:hypothetical protein
MITLLRIQEDHPMPSEAEYQDKLKRFLKAELKRAEITYEDLAAKLEAHGIAGETKASIANKLSRGSFPASFLLAVVAVIGLTEIALEDL